MYLSGRHAAGPAGLLGDTFFLIGFARGMKPKRVPTSISQLHFDLLVSHAVPSVVSGIHAN